MPFNPTLPLAGLQVNSADLRDQFNGLKDLIDAQAAQISALETAMATVLAQLPNLVTQADVEPITANNIDGVSELTLTLSDPPVTSELEQVLSKLNEAIAGLHR